MQTVQSLKDATHAGVTYFGRYNDADRVPGLIEKISQENICIVRSAYTVWETTAFLRGKYLARDADGRFVVVRWEMHLCEIPETVAEDRDAARAYAVECFEACELENQTVYLDFSAV